jgi:hypothetical protein
MQQASRWGEHDRGEKGEHDRGKPYHYDTTGDCGKSGRPSREHDRGEKVNMIGASPITTI